MAILPHYPSWGVQTVKTRLLTGRTILSLLAVFLTEPRGSSICSWSRWVTSFSDIRYKVPPVRKYGHNG